MLKYLTKRILMVIPVMIGVSIIVFALMRVFSPDPAPIVLGQHATQEQIGRWRQGNGLNEPIVKQYFTYISGALHGDLGTSVLQQHAGLRRDRRPLPRDDRVGARGDHLRFDRRSHTRSGGGGEQELDLRCRRARWSR